MSEKTTQETLKEIEQIGPLNLHNDPDYMFNLTMIKIIHNIKDTMKKENISASDLARKINKSRQHVHKILDEKRNLTIKSLVKIAIALDCEIDIHLEKL